MSPQPILKIGSFPETMQRVIDAEFACHDEAEVEQSDDLRARIRAIVTRSNYTVPLPLLQRLPQLAVIATSGVGHDGIPVGRGQGARRGRHQHAGRPRRRG